MDADKPIAVCPRGSHVLYDGMGAMRLGKMWLMKTDKCETSNLPVIDCVGGLGKTCEDHENARA